MSPERVGRRPGPVPPWGTVDGVAARRPRGGHTVADMVRSLAVVLAMVAAIVLLTPRQNLEAVKVIDYSQQLRAARTVAPYHVYAPVGLPSGWRATSVRYQPDVAGAATWHLGFVTPSVQYAAVEQSNGPADPFIGAMTNWSQPQGALLVGQVPWEKRYRADKDQRALVRVSGSMTVVVTGTASWTELTELAAALR